MNDLSCGVKMWAQVPFVFVTKRVWQTDGQKGLGNTTVLHYMQSHG